MGGSYGQPRVCFVCSNETDVDKLKFVKQILIILSSGKRQCKVLHRQGSYPIPEQKKLLSYYICFFFQLYVSSKYILIIFNRLQL